MKKRNYRTPGRMAASAAAKTEPGAPRARRITKEPRKSRARQKPEPALPAEEEVIPGVKLRPESAFEKDPDFPPSKVRLKDHHEKPEKLAESIASFAAAGFLPNAISRLVGLCPADCRTLKTSHET